MRSLGGGWCPRQPAREGGRIRRDRPGTVLPEDRARATARIVQDRELDCAVERGDGLPMTGGGEARGRRRRECKDLTQSEVLDDQKDDDDAARLGRPPSPELHAHQYIHIRRCAILLAFRGHDREPPPRRIPCRSTSCCPLCPRRAVRCFASCLGPSARSMRRSVGWGSGSSPSMRSSVPTTSSRCWRPPTTRPSPASRSNSAPAVLFR